MIAQEYKITPRESYSINLISCKFHQTSETFTSHTSKCVCKLDGATSYILKLFFKCLEIIFALFSLNLVILLYIVYGTQDSLGVDITTRMINSYVLYLIIFRSFNNIGGDIIMAFLKMPRRLISMDREVPVRNRYFIANYFPHSPSTL